jgi:hypothetical protein
MITTLIKAPVKTAAGTARLVSRPGIWLVRTLAGVALKPLQGERPPEPPPTPSAAKSQRSGPSRSTGGPRSAGRSRAPGKPRSARRSRSTKTSTQAPHRAPSPERTTGSGAGTTTSRARSQPVRESEQAVTPPPFDPEHSGVPGRDVPPALPAEPHHMLNTPVGEPDPTEWPDPYDRRPDPRDPNPDDPLPIGDVPHPPTGAHSTSAPHPDQDPEAVRPRAAERDRLDE